MTVWWTATHAVLIGQEMARPRRGSRVEDIKKSIDDSQVALNLTNAGFLCKLDCTFLVAPQADRHSPAFVRFHLSCLCNCQWKRSPSPWPNPSREQQDVARLERGMKPSKWATSVAYTNTSERTKSRYTGRRGNSMVSSHFHPSTWAYFSLLEPVSRMMKKTESKRRAGQHGC